MSDTTVPVYNVGIFLFNEVEVLDFAGPFEVFSISVHSDGSKAFRVYTVSENGQMISARNGLQVQPEYSFATLPSVDILIIPGGYGAEEIEIHKPQVIEWIRSHAAQQRVVASICTGALLLAEASLLDGLSATTHWMDLERLERDYPKVQTRSGIKYVDEGQILTSGGISAGIHLSLHLVRRYTGIETAERTARRMEYDWNE
ncbi:DJ-1/PfpI family protein [Paenibacillus bovis]|uniref:AraC family transcriptional regulator n=1 Tax=Paenibacillus bovis TaxID=1616788 RepID=A0A172ZL08_9BACL|nr:DJ-1/PfpI family protein [Paenibacillus bovis]ANF98331.1 AraC family transcriptional regulator [Paenibacillus bovis]